MGPQIVKSKNQPTTFTHANFPSCAWLIQSLQSAELRRKESKGQSTLTSISRETSEVIWSRTYNATSEFINCCFPGNVCAFFNINAPTLVLITYRKLELFLVCFNLKVNILSWDCSLVVGVFASMSEAWVPLPCLKQSVVAPTVTPGLGGGGRRIRCSGSPSAV